jgi:hypothetical protein
MYDPARDIFTETQSAVSPPLREAHEISALDTLAGLAAEAQLATLPPKKDETRDEITVKEEEPVKENGYEPGVNLRSDGGIVSDGVGGGGGGVVAMDGAEVARTKGPGKSLKVTLHLKKAINKVNSDTKNIKIDEEDGIREPEPEKKSQMMEDPVDQKIESPVSPAKDVSSPKIEEKVPTPKVTPPKNETPKVESPKESSPKKQDPSASPESRPERNEPLYPVPLSLAKLSKIPKRKVDDREPRPPGENKDRNSSRPRDSQFRGPPRSPPRRPRSPPRRPSDNRYPPQHIDSYRPGRDRDDHYPPPKRPRSPSPPRQLKRPVRKDVSAADRERERRERQLRDQEREKAELEAARSRPVYETVRQHYNEREERGREARQESRIFRLRKFNNWIKSVLIAKFIPERTEEEIDEGRGLFILDIGCGKGGDLGKWQKQPQIQAYVGVDVAEVSIMHAEQRAAELRGRRFSTRFFTMDCFSVAC